MLKLNQIKALNQINWSKAAICLLYATLLTFSSCKDEHTTYHRSSVPIYPVHLEINILTEEPTLQPTNTAAFRTYTTRRYEQDALGYAGILLYVATDAQYHAYDLACPHCISRTQPIQVDGYTAECPICHEIYFVGDGTAVPTKGISNEALLSYHTYYNATSGKLTISN